MELDPTTKTTASTMGGVPPETLDSAPTTSGHSSSTTAMDSITTLTPSMDGTTNTHIPTTKHTTTTHMPTTTRASTTHTPTTSTHKPTTTHTSTTTRLPTTTKMPTTTRTSTITTTAKRTTSTPIVSTTTTTTPVPTTTSTSTTMTSTTTTCFKRRAFCSDCGIASINVPDFKIVNGTEAEDYEYPYQVVVLSFILGYDRHCAGSIITKSWILTAAHCLQDTSGNIAIKNDYYVGYGHGNRRYVTFMYGLELILHDFNYESFDNDISLIRAGHILHYEYNLNYQPICMAEESDIPFGGKAIATGWGTTEYDFSVGTLQLHELALDVITMEECAEISFLPSNISKAVCAIIPNKGVCEGDSGGPLVAQVCPNQYVQIGIASYGVGECAHPVYPSVYTRVSAYTDWIYNHIKDCLICSSGWGS